MCRVVRSLLRAMNPYLVAVNTLEDGSTPQESVRVHAWVVTCRLLHSRVLALIDLSAVRRPNSPIASANPPGSDSFSISTVSSSPRSNIGLSRMISSLLNEHAVFSTLFVLYVTYFNRALYVNILFLDIRNEIHSFNPGA